MLYDEPTCSKQHVRLLQYYAPIEEGIMCQLVKLDTPKVDALEYEGRVGSVMYVMTGTCSDLAFAVGMLSQHMATPGEIHKTALKCVQWYIRKMTYTYLIF